MPLATIADLNGPTEEVIRRIGQAKKLSELYNNFVAYEQDGHDRAPGIHASELYPCLRQPVYSLMGTPRRPQVSKFWKQRFKVGTAIHLMLQDDFHRMSKATLIDAAFQHATAEAMEMDCVLQFEDELTISPKHQALAERHQLYSHCDGVFTFRDRGTGEIVLRIGLEAKSKSDPEYEKLRVPEASHIRQAHIYMACLDLPLMWFFYMNKSNQNNTKTEAPWLVVYQPAVWAEMEDRLRIVHDFAARKELPVRTETVICEFCAWAYECQPANMMKALQQQNSNRKESIRLPGA